MSKVTEKLEILTSKCKLVPRVDVLRKLEGIYYVNTYVGDVFSPLFIYCDLNLWHGGKISTVTARGMKISRVLVKAGFSSDEVSRFMKCFIKDEVVISCKFNDILRMGESKHFTSCLSYKKGCYRTALDWYLSNPDVAIIFKRDRGGEMLWRGTLLLTTRGICVLNAHGTSNYMISSVLEKIEGLNINIVEDYKRQEIVSYSRFYSNQQIVRKRMKYNAVAETLYDSASCRIIYKL